MRRADRQITDFNSIIEIIKRCDTLRLGFADGNYPYIVPVNFGYEISGEQICFYIHGATEGKKVDLINKNGVCSFELDCDHRVEVNVEKQMATMKYSSVMGKADIKILSDDEKLHGISVLLDCYDETTDFEFNPNVLSRTMIAKLTVLEYTAKSNIK